MIIILEGCNGVGKTELAKAIAQALAFPILRPFRSGTQHMGDGGGLERVLKRLDVPFNTHVDDLYVADFMRQVHASGGIVSAILDRSMGSAIAYSAPMEQRQLLMATWQSLLATVPRVFYAWLKAPYAVADRRMAERGAWLDQARYELLESRFQYVYERVDFPKVAIDTSQTTVPELLAEVMSCLPWKN